MNIKTVRFAALGMALLIVSTLVFTANWQVVKAQETGSNWQGYYWNNQNFTGNPTVTRTDSTVNFNWGTGSPDPNIPADHFSVRWYNTLNFGNGGTYNFVAGAEDGIRVAVDNNVIINRFTDVSAFTQSSATIAVGGGNHILIVDYYNDTGPAGVQFSWTTQSGSVPVEANTAVPTAVPGPTSAPAAPGITAPTAFHIRAEVRVELANLRNLPNAGSDMLGQVKFGSQLIVTASNGDGTWYFVTTKDGKQGWMFRHNMVLYGGNPAQLAVSQSVVSPSAGPVNVQGTTKFATLVRDFPSKRTGNKIGAINAFETFTVLKLSRNRAWVFIDDNGLRGWVFLPNIQVVLGSIGSLPLSSQ